MSWKNWLSHTIWQTTIVWIDWYKFVLQSTEDCHRMLIAINSLTNDAYEKWLAKGKESTKRSTKRVTKRNTNK